MGVAGDNQTEAAADRRKDVRIVREHQHRSSVGDLSHRAWNVMWPGVEIGDANQPESRAASLNLHRAVVEYADSNTLQSSRNAAAIEPPIVIAEAGPYTERRGKPGEHFRSGFGGDEAAAEDFLDHQITGNDNEIRLECIGEGHDPLQLCKP